ncbi:MAG TPA: hypothetical protein VGP73_03695 [Thermoanaerobaculia bacterium]
MSHWRRLSRKNRALLLVIAILALAATALASTRLASTRRSLATKAEGSDSLGGTLPPPADVFIQQTADFPDLGNVLLTVQLTPEQVAAKQKEGTASYTTLGSSGELFFRDDGQGGEAVAGDGLYTTVAQVDLKDVESRAQQDAATLETASSEIPVFSGRALAGSQAQTVFDLQGFQAGKSVRLNRPVISGPAGPVGPVDPIDFDTVTPFQHHVLMITDPKVIADPTRTTDPCDPGSGTPGGSWTFKHLITEMAANTSLSPSAFTEAWLKTWLSNQTINTFGVPKRLVMQGILNDWHTESSYTIGSTTDLDLDIAPFRLIAIVPRLDLRGGPGSGGASYLSAAGELRFIFGFVRPFWMSSLPSSGYGRSCALPFTAIFEYKIPARSCTGMVSLAGQWMALDRLVPGDAPYNSALEHLTEPVVKANADLTRPYGSAIGQVRTNEIALADPASWPPDPWQLREFHLSTTPSWNPLGETTTANTPDDSFNNGASFQSWILSQIEPAISGPGWQQAIPDVPSSYLSAPFLGARPEMPTAAFFWNAPGLSLSPSSGNNPDNWGRHRASLNTCNGCHAGETGTPFVHVDPMKPLGDWHALSGFLRGITVNDPAEASHLPHRTFSDLARREADLRALAGSLCAMVPPVDIAQVRDGLATTGKIPAHPFTSPIDPSQLLSLPADDLKANHVTEVH